MGIRDLAPPCSFAELLLRVSLDVRIKVLGSGTLLNKTVGRVAPKHGTRLFVR